MRTYKATKIRKSIGERGWGGVGSKLQMKDLKFRYLRYF